MLMAALAIDRRGGAMLVCELQPILHSGC
jgi:hypothetical protein